MLGAVSLPGDVEHHRSEQYQPGLGWVTGSTGNNVIANNISGGGGLAIASFTESDASAWTITFNGTGNTTVGASARMGTMPWH